MRSERAATNLASTREPRVEAESETMLRDRLGIPRDAQRVLLFSESSHWDTNWLRTSDEYFDERLRPIFLAVLKALEQDPRRVYCVESVFFLKIFWERHPEERARLRTLTERRQLRVLTSRTAYFPDNFGHSPHLPSLMRAVGVPSQTVRDAFLCNAREETLGPLAIERGQVLVALRARLTTIRLVVVERST